MQRIPILDPGSVASLSFEKEGIESTIAEAVLDLALQRTLVPQADLLHDPAKGFLLPGLLGLFLWLDLRDVDENNF